MQPEQRAALLAAGVVPTGKRKRDGSQKPGTRHYLEVTTDDLDDFIRGKGWRWHCYGHSHSVEVDSDDFCKAAPWPAGTPLLPVLAEALLAALAQDAPPAKCERCGEPTYGAICIACVDRDRQPVSSETADPSARYGDVDMRATSTFDPPAPPAIQPGVTYFVKRGAPATMAEVNPTTGDDRGWKRHTKTLRVWSKGLYENSYHGRADNSPDPVDVGVTFMADDLSLTPWPDAPPDAPAEHVYAVGDRVRVVGRVATDEQRGGDTEWMPAMNGYVGNTCIVRGVAEDGRIGLGARDEVYFWFHPLDLAHAVEFLAATPQPGTGGQTYD